MKKIIVSIIIIGMLLNITPLSIGEEETFDGKSSDVNGSLLSGNTDQLFLCGDNNQSGVKIHKDGCYEGYTLMSNLGCVNLDSEARLIDMNGTTRNRWGISLSGQIFPFPAKMLQGGDIIVGKKPLKDFILSKFSHAYTDNKELIQMDWNGTKIWSFSNWTELETGEKRARQHHDFQREGNPVGYYAPGQDFVSNGKTLILAHNDTNNSDISNISLIDDIIYEVDWNGNLTGFEWRASEHFDEMGFDEDAKDGIRNSTGCKKPNVSWNWIYEDFAPGDWLHINSVSRLGKNKWYDMDPINYSYFHPENIIIDSRHANFIAVIGRETGDIVWRVGPDYSDNTEEGRKIGQIIGPHHAHMIPDGLPGAGNILLFDNGGTAGYGKNGCPNKFRNYSRVIEFNPITKDIVWEYSNKKSDIVDLTFFIHWKIIRSGENHHFFSPYVSSAQRLPNGNTLITEGCSGRIFEVTLEKEIVWDYINILSIFYRAYRIPPEWVPNNSANYQYWEEGIDSYSTSSQNFFTQSQSSQSSQQNNQLLHLPINKNN